MSLQKSYEKIAKKNKRLPSWKWLKDNFNLKECEDFPPLEQIRQLISERVDNVINIIEPLVSTNESYSNWIERKMLTKDEKEEAFEVYKNLQAFIWASDKVAISKSEKDYEELFIMLKSEWEPMKALLIKIFDKIYHGWKVYTKDHELKSYYTD